MMGLKGKIITIVIVLILISGSILWYVCTNIDDDKEDDFNYAATNPISGNNTVLLDPLLRTYKPGVLAEIVMQAIHGTSVKKNESYLKNWSDNELDDYGFVNGSYSHINHTGIFRNVYYSTDSYPKITIEGNETVGCARISYSNSRISSEPHHIVNDEEKEEAKTKILSVIEAIGLSMNGSESFSYTNMYSPAYDPNFYFSSVEVYQGIATVDFQYWYGSGIKVSINAENEISGFSICCWLDRESIPEVITREEVFNLALNYIDVTHDEYWKVRGSFGLKTNGYMLYYSGDMGVEKNLELYDRMLKITAVDGKIIYDFKGYWGHHGSPEVGWKIKTDKKEYSVGEDVHIELWLVNYWYDERTLCVRTPPNDQKFNITNTSINCKAPFLTDAPEDWDYVNITLSNNSEVIVYNFTWNQTFQADIFQDMPSNINGMQVPSGTYWISTFIIEDNHSHHYWRQWSRRMIQII